MAKYTSNLIPGSITFCGVVYNVDSQSCSVKFGRLALSAHSETGDRCHIFYDFCDQMDAVTEDNLEDVLDEGGKQAYADSLCGALNFEKPSHVTNEDLLTRIFPDGSTDDGGMVAHW